MNAILDRFMGRKDYRRMLDERCLLIRRNHGANHLIVGRDHAGPGNDSNGGGRRG